MAQSEVAPASNGRWQPGQSGNPAGRKPGTKNHIVLLQRELEVAVREHLSVDRVKKIITKLADMAESGHVHAAKLLLDKMIPNAVAAAEESDESGRKVVFQIVNATFAASHQLTQPDKPPSEPEPVEAEYVESPPTLVRQDQDGN